MEPEEFKQLRENAWERYKDRKVNLTYEEFQKVVKKFTEPLQKTIHRQNSEIQKMQNEIIFLKN